MRLATDVVLERELVNLQDMASGLGHELTDPEMDTEVSYVTECVRCEQVFGVDGQERPYIQPRPEVPCTMRAMALV